MVSPAFLGALASVRSSLRDLLEIPSLPGHPLDIAIQEELATSDKHNVREALISGDVLRAANSSYASEPFQHEIGRILVPVVRPLVDELVAAFGDALDHESGGNLVIRVDAARASHLPRARRQDGVLRKSDAREVLSAALGDPVIVAIWSSVQRGSTAAPMGFARYAANNSSFVNRQRLFGARVSLANVFSAERDLSEDSPLPNTKRDRYMYDFEEALACHYEDAYGGQAWVEEASLWHSGQERTDDLEYDLLSETRRRVGDFPVTVFGALFDALCLTSEKKLRALLLGHGRETLLTSSARLSLTRASGMDGASLRWLEAEIVQVLRNFQRDAARRQEAA